MHPFRAAVEARDLDAMRLALHADVVFRSPAVFTPYEGIDTVMELLANVVEVFEDFAYTDELEGTEGHTHALVFRARVGGKQLAGLDHLTLDDDGLVRELVVMIRPLSGLIALAQEMGARLEART